MRSLASKPFPRYPSKYLGTCRVVVHVQSFSLEYLLQRVLLTELEVEHIEVLGNPFFTNRFGDGHDAALREPAQNDLSYRLFVLFRKGR